ncbi:hypothetical protein AB0J38_07630 [Streptomyces sp. NPDC050095]|uniref:hypothetical protein n=1 Tax=unclassified Streptomyces TaxID=2593676 RepID=UPI00342E6C6D
MERELFAGLSECERRALRTALGKLRASPEGFTCTGEDAGQQAAFPFVREVVRDVVRGVV